MTAFAVRLPASACAAPRAMSRALLTTSVFWLAVAAEAAAEGIQVAAGAMTPNPVAAAPAPEDWSVRGQFTNVTQWHPAFTSPYSGANSLDPQSNGNETSDVTFYAGRRLSENSEIWVNPEIDQGFGLSNTLGVAGFPSGEAYKVGANEPYLRVPRLFYRRVINLGGACQTVESAINQLAASKTEDNVALTVGKFSVVDVFDTNSYAHDPRNDFLNWAVVDAGAFDYAADSWGYAYGAAVEWTQSWWTWRNGFFNLSKVPNGKNMQMNFAQHEFVTEFEERHHWLGHPGKLKLLLFVNRGDMGSYADAVQLARQTGATPDTALVRRGSSRAGIAVNFEQELRPGVGAFVRASQNDGAKEAFEFADINKSVSGGVSMQGDLWGRADDAVGAAIVANALSGAAQDYFASGGLGVLIGDGQLKNYGLEKIGEFYYSISASGHVKVSFDYQYVVNPAYNRDRGPVSIYGARVHAEF